MNRDVTNFHEAFLSLFPNDLKITFDFELNSSRHFKVNLPDGTIWAFSASLRFHSGEWFYKVTNNFIGENWMKYVVNLKEKSCNAKVNFLLTAEKANKATVIRDLFAFQENVIFEVLPSIWQDEGYTYYSFQGVNHLIEGQFNDSQVDAMNEKVFKKISIVGHDIAELSFLK